MSTPETDIGARSSPAAASKASVKGSRRRATVLIVGIFLGITAWGGVNTAIEWSNRSDFCISCHEMRVPYEELKKTLHFNNRTGTTVACADCHVASGKTPEDYGRKFAMKLVAARDLVAHLAGRLDGPKEFDAHRLEMAERVWARMSEADSKECRNCHDFNTMDMSKQKSRSRAMHEEAQENRKTCIECHKGIAHAPAHGNLEERDAMAIRRNGAG